MIEKADAPDIKNKAAWHKPHVLQWLNALGKAEPVNEMRHARLRN
jgi:hypothetical protein